MTAATLNQADTATLAAHEFAPPCDHGVGFVDGTQPCDKAAEWFLLNACCGRASLRCPEHYELSLRLHEMAPLITHAACGHDWHRGATASERYSAIERL